MLPLGLVLFAQDVPPLQKPMAQGLGWIERKWLERERAKLERERAKVRMSHQAAARHSTDFVFGCDRTHTCDSKTSLVGNYVASSRHPINFSFANQPADLFSASGVNLEAKV